MSNPIISDTDFDLLKKISLGDNGAFKTFFVNYWPQVYKTCFRLTKDSEKAEDLSQDIFFKIWNNREQLEFVSNISGYIYTVSRNLIMDSLRKKVFNFENIDYLTNYFQDRELGPHQSLEYKELDSLLSQAIEQLPGKVGEVYKLSRFEGLTHEQIAQRLNITAVTSKTYIVRALQSIRKFMEINSSASVVLAALMIIH